MVRVVELKNDHGLLRTLSHYLNSIFNETNPFGYSSLQNPLIFDVSFTIKPCLGYFSQNLPKTDVKRMKNEDHFF